MKGNGCLVNFFLAAILLGVAYLGFLFYQDQASCVPAGKPLVYACVVDLHPFPKDPVEVTSGS